jgi:serine/threonine protein kinase
MSRIVARMSRVLRCAARQRPEFSAALGTDRLLREITTTANLRHPHILPLYDSGAGDGILFHVMPFVEGGSLRVRLDRESQGAELPSGRYGALDAAGASPHPYPDLCASSSISIISPGSARPLTSSQLPVGNCFV